MTEQLTFCSVSGKGSSAGIQLKYFLNLCVPSCHPQFDAKKKKNLSSILIIDWVFIIFIDIDHIFVQLSKHCFL